MGVPLDPSRPVDPNADRCRRLLVRRPDQRRVLVGEGRADRVADGAADARHARPVRPLGVGLLQAVQADRRPHRRRPQRSRRSLAQQLDPMLGFALLTAVDTYTYRSDAVMLSTAQSYRPGNGERAAPHLAGHARRARDRVHHAPEERAAVGHAVAGRRRLLDRQREPAAGRAARRALDEPVHAGVSPIRGRRSTRSATCRTRTRTSRRSGSTRWCRPAAGRSAGRATATSRCGRGGPTHWRTYSDPGIFTHGLRESFDLVADGGRRQRVAHAGRRRRAVPRLRRVPHRGARRTPRG